VQEAGEAGYVLVAGGLGERLGYSGIKVALPAESASGICFLQLYIEYILALQEKAQDRFPGRRLPLVIMTSDDTHARTQALLDAHSNFGAEEDQIKLLKQEKVACLADNDAHLALASGDQYTVQTKPHGHGDVHMLLHSSGVAEEWANSGLKWVCFFQDTNAQVFRALPAALGVSAERDFDVNSLAVPRKAKEAIGAIARLKSSSGNDTKEMTINVEYNQLDPLLRATISPEGDVNDPNTGFSPFPGNINQLVLKLSTYVAELKRHGGVIGEFVNPKYADSSRTAFKSSTRLECMMQDFPKSLPEGSKVGFTVINQVWAAYSPVKNSPADAAAKAATGNPSHSATTGELDIYETNCHMLRMIGVSVDDPEGTVTFNGISGLHLWPRVTWSPLFASTFDDLEAKINVKKVHIGADSTLIIRAADAKIENLDLKRGAVVIEAPVGVAVVVDEKEVIENDGWEWAPLDPDAGAVEEEYIRGFKVVKKETKELS
jgi:UDP-sugar pyrophosphorylase